MSKDSKKAKSLVSACAHSIPHLGCCVGPNVFANALGNAVSHFLHSTVGVVAQVLFIPPLATGLSNEVTPHILKGINTVKYKWVKNDPQECERKNAAIKKRPNDMRKKAWWLDKKNVKNMLYGGLIIQPTCIFLAHTFLHNHENENNHDGHDHANIEHFQHNHDETCTKTHEESDKAYYFGMHNKKLAQPTP